MRLETFVLADAVSAPPDGKFYVLGGGITRFNLIQFPAAVQLGVYARFELDQDEPVASHQIRIHFIGPNGVDLLNGGPEIPVQAPEEPPNWEEGEARFVAIAINMGPVPIQEHGVYTLRLDLDGDTMREMKLPAVVPAPIQQI